MKSKLIIISLIVSALFLAGCSKEGSDIQNPDIPLVADPETNTQLTDVFPINESDGLGASNYGFINYSGEVYQGMLNDPSIEKIPAGYVQTKAAFIPEAGLEIYAEGYIAESNTFVNPKIICGLDAFGINLTGVKDEDLFRVRSNLTNKLIVLSNSDCTDLLKSYSLAAEYISRSKIPQDNTVVLNGRLTDLKFVKDSEGLFWIETEPLFDTLCWSYDEYTDYIILHNPCTDIQMFTSPVLGNTDYKAYWLSENTQPEEFWYRSYTWGDNFKVLKKLSDDMNYWCEASALSRITGIKIYTSDKLLVIETDPLDIPDEFYEKDAETGTYKLVAKR